MAATTPKMARDGPPTEERIIRKSLHNEVAERVREMIVAGQLEEGTRLREQQLCEQFGISRTPLREALKVLAFEGLLELLPNRGMQVTKLTVGDLEQMFKVMEVLEALSGELACDRITDAEIETIERLQKDMERFMDDGDLYSLFKVDQKIHTRIVDATCNDVLKGMYLTLARRMRRARFAGSQPDDKQRGLVQDHKDMVVALRARDGKRLAKIMRRHMRRKHKIARKAVASKS